MYHREKDCDPQAHTLALTLSDNKNFTSEEERLHCPLTVTWALRSITDLSTNKAAIRLSSADRARDFSMDSHGHTLIIPPSEPDHTSPGSKPQKS